MKYIDQKMLRAEIEKRFWVYGTPLYDDEVTEKVDEILEIIDSLQQDHLPDAGEMVEQEHIADASKMMDQTSLPSNLDEAAEEYERNLGYYECINQWPSVAFKAGAEWQEKRNEETIETAEDHAYFAGKENMREELLEWLDGKLTIEGATEGFVGGYDSALKDVIDKLNSM